MPEPRVTSAVLVQWGDYFLLGKRNKANGLGKWVIPGGGIQWGEKAVDAAKREIKEETNLDVEIKKFLSSQEVIATDAGYHTLIFFYLAEAKNPQELRAGDDLSEVQFFTLDQIKKLDTVESVKKVFTEAGWWPN